MSRAVRLVEIRDAVCFDFGLRPAELLSPDRTRETVVPRHCAFWLARNLTQHSYPAIAAAFGRENHTTVMHGVQVHAVRMRADKRVSARTERLRSRLLEGKPIGLTPPVLPLGTHSRSTREILRCR